MTDHTTRDAAEIRASWEDDSERIIRRVHAALNSGRDAAVVQVVLDEAESAAQELALIKDTLRRRTEAMHRALTRADKAEAALSAPRHCRACGRDVTVQP